MGGRERNGAARLAVERTRHPLKGVANLALKGVANLVAIAGTAATLALAGVAIFLLATGARIT